MTVYKTDYGLYWENDLIVLYHTSGHKIEEIKKSTIKNFNEVYFEIEITSLFKIVAFSDVTFNIRKHIFKPSAKIIKTLPSLNKIHPKRLFLTT